MNDDHNQRGTRRRGEENSQSTTDRNHVAKEAKHDATRGVTTNLNVEEDLVGHRRVRRHALHVRDGEILM